MCLKTKSRANTHSLAWSLAAYRTLTTAVSVSVFTAGKQPSQLTTAQYTTGRCCETRLQINSSGPKKEKNTGGSGFFFFFLLCYLSVTTTCLGEPADPGTPCGGLPCSQLSTVPY